MDERIAQIRRNQIKGLQVVALFRNWTSPSTGSTKTSMFVKINGVTIGCIYASTFTDKREQVRRLLFKAGFGLSESAQGASDAVVMVLPCERKSDLLTYPVSE